MVLDTSEGEKRMKHLFVVACILAMVAGCGYVSSSTVIESVDSWSGNTVRTTDNPWISIGDGSLAGSLFGSNNVACLDARVVFVNDKPITCVMVLNVRNVIDWMLSSHEDIIVRAGEVEFHLEPIPGHHSHECFSTGYGAFRGMSYSERNEYSVSLGDYRTLGEVDSIDVRFSTPEGTYAMFSMASDLFAQSLLDTIPVQTLSPRERERAEFSNQSE
jgi:hypothetical protein